MGRDAREPAFLGHEDKLNPLAACYKDSRPSGKEPPQAEVLPRGGPSEQQQRSDKHGAALVISAFCESFPATRFEPTHGELRTCWAGCAPFSRESVTAALMKQIADAGSSHEWQPHWRALRLLAHLYTEGEAGRAIAQKVTTRAADLLRFFTLEVPECQEIATRILLLQQLAEVLPPGQEVRFADEGGILYFTSDAQCGPPATDAVCGVARPRDVEPMVDVSASPGAASADLLGLSSCRGNLPNVMDASGAASAPAPLSGVGASAEPLLDLSPPCFDTSVGHASSPPVQLQICTHELERLQPLECSGADLVGKATSTTSTPSLPEVYNIGGKEVSIDNPELCRMFSFGFGPAIDDSKSDASRGGKLDNCKRSLPMSSPRTGMALTSQTTIPLVTDAYMREHLPRQRDPFDFVAQFIEST